MWTLSISEDGQTDKSPTQYHSNAEARRDMKRFTGKFLTKPKVSVNDKGGAYCATVGKYTIKISQN